MPSYLDFNQTKKFRDYILSKNIQYPNGPQTFTEDSYTVKNFNVLSNRDLGDVTNDRGLNLGITKQTNIFKPVDYLIIEDFKTIPIKNSLQLYPYFTQKNNQTLISILNSDNYDNESNLMKFSSNFIKNDPNGPIKARIAQNLESNISGKIRVLDALDGFSSSAFNIISGKEPLIEKNNKITVNNDLIGKGIDFIKTITGVELPFSEIKGEYFRNSKTTYRTTPKSELGKTLQDLTGILGSLIGIDRKPKINSKPSDLFLKYTGSGNKTALFDTLSYSRYRPNYTTKATSQNTSKLFNFTDNLTQDVKNLLGNEAPTGNSYIGDDRDNDVKYAMTDYNDNYVRGNYYLSSMFDPIQTNLFEIDKNIQEGGSLSGNFTWISKNNNNKLGKNIENNSEYDREQTATLIESLSTKYNFREDSILKKTQDILDSRPIDGGSAISHVANVIDQTSRIFKNGNKLISKGSAVKYVNKFNEERGVEYCRVWTKDNPYSLYSDTMKRTGLIRKIDSSVLSRPWNLNIGPMSDGNKQFGTSTNIGDTFPFGRDSDGKGFYAKKYMFSIENLAWKSSTLQGYTVLDLPYCERGSNGGRVMWFPPYDLKFSEQNSAKWDENNFIGRSEPIYTYQNTTRTGNLSFKIVVDHPSILNLLVREHFKDMNDDEATNYINAFFAGCEDLEFYELITSYTTLDKNDLESVKNFLNENKDITKTNTSSTLAQQPAIEVTNVNLTPQNNSEEKIEKIINLNFDDDYPKITNDKITSSSPFNELYNSFIVKKVDYKTRLRTSLNSLKNSVHNKEKLYIFNNINPTDADITNQVDKLDTYFSGLTTNYTLFTEKLDTLKSDLLIDSVDNINIVLSSSTSASGSEKYNNELSVRRNYSLLLDIINKLSNGASPKIPWKKVSDLNLNEDILFDLKISLKEFGYKNNNGVLNLRINSLGETRKECKNKDFIKIKDLNIVSPLCFSCRQSIFMLKYNKKLINPINPNIPPISKIEPIVIDNNKTIINNDTNINKRTPIDLMKKIVMKTLSESFYFKKIEENTPLVFNSLKEKLKYFHPGFHSTTPEGLNSRLTFLLQCLRPSNTIPVKGVSNNIRNTSFGPPPICVLRIGDFYNTKVIIRDVNLTYDDSPLDLNPEGIGVQPMIATVSLAISFIGGHGMEKPVEMLQNSLTSNFFANTEIYDDRAFNTLTKIDNKEINLFAEKFLSKTLQKTTENDNIKNNDVIKEGNYIGVKVDNTLSYKSLVTDVHDDVKNYYERLKGLYNYLNNTYGPILTSLFLSNNYRVINEFDVNYNSLNSIKTINLLGNYKQIKNLSKYKDELLTNFMYILDNNSISEILTLNTKFNSNDVGIIDRFLTKPLKELIKNLLLNIDNIQQLTEFEDKFRNPLTKKLDKLNYIIKNNRDVVYRGEKYYDVDLTGFNYNILYSEYKNCIDYLDENDFLTPILNNDVNFNNLNLTVENVRNILKFLFKDNNMRVEFLSLFQQNDFYNKNQAKINSFLEKFINVEKTHNFKLKPYPKPKNNLDLKFIIDTEEITNDEAKINQAKLLLTDKKIISNKLNNNN
jgi:hypothetical protein